MKNMMDFEQDYFHWLCELVHIEQEERSYWLLAKDLHDKKFYSNVPHDENRAYDGLELRDEYLSAMGFPDYVTIDGECSVLEMLVGLARRISFETSDPDDMAGQDHTCYWFWEMIDNLGLTKYDDESYVDEEGQIYVDCALDILLGRNYKPDGEGGLFPLHNCSVNQRRVELWYQMCAYLNQRYAM